MPFGRDAIAIRDQLTLAFRVVVDVLDDVLSRGVDVE